MKIRKLDCLKGRIKRYKSVVVAFSGGMDSSFLLKVAYDVLGDKVLAVSVDSPFLPRLSHRRARIFTKKYCIPHICITCKLPKICWLNTERRCFYCKQALFKNIQKVAKKQDIPFIMEASHVSDHTDYRPGHQALRQLGILSPLVKSNFTKKDIICFSKKMHLRSAGLEATCCMATRIPYGEKITSKKLARIDRLEKYLKKYNLKNIRLRSHGNLARIEVKLEDISRVVYNRQKIVKRLKQEGFKYVALDMEGYQQGSMNRVVLWKNKK